MAHLSWADARRVEVTATVPHGVVLSARWPCLLDGILASVARRRRLGLGYGDVVDHHVDDLPLCLLPNNTRAGKRWSWLASCGVPVDDRGVEARWWHSRFDHVAAEHVVPNLPKTVVEHGGRYKAWRMPSVATVCTTVRWRAIGDASGIADMLAEVRSIGDARGKGEGAVDDWRVADLGAVGGPIMTTMRESAWWVLGSDGADRPVHVRHASLLGLSDNVDTVPGIIRPPYWRAGIQHTGRREMLPVIAPWVRRVAEEVTDDVPA